MVLPSFKSEMAASEFPQIILTRTRRKKLSAPQRCVEIIYNFLSSLIADISDLSQEYPKQWQPQANNINHKINFDSSLLFIMNLNRTNGRLWGWFKGSGHYWLLLKLIISIKPFLVTSNGERLIV